MSSMFAPAILIAQGSLSAVKMKAAGLNLNLLEYWILVAVRLPDAQAGQARTTSTEHPAMDRSSEGRHS